ncbi:mRNA-processing factor 6 [Seminavis robusta]|uniref:mRNA-processing factor 6 n=1 Tax=Seminavis robusta TaxID=568900 RepID=A0A9N8HMC6_9STRA|nr:mRNA-processing factor 6 [Seminavis robusta]|eukprot:Sro987_g228260.1 mRNA-processing factor 6 (973) ;mRNA; f:25000-28017
MAFRGRGRAAPAGYVPGLGRGAAGFTTRSDVGPMAAPGSVDDAADASGSGSRSSELRAAKMAMRQQQQKQQQGMFGAAPQGYVPGAGRGANMGKADNEGGPTGSYDSFGGYNNDRPVDESQYDDDDDEADKIWAAIDERMASKRKRKGANSAAQDEEDEQKSSRSKIGVQFRELKEKLADVTEDQWANIPEVGDYSLKFKQKQRQEVYTPVSDSLLEQRTNANLDATAGTTGTGIAATTSAFESGTVTNMSGVGAARGKVLGMSLDSMSDSISGQTVVDPQGYLTSLSSTKIATNAEVSDINKARLLLKSVRDTNPKHAPGWIASARVEEAAGKILQARKIIQEGCNVCSDSEDVWLEAARLHPQEVAKSILATAVRKIPTSVKIFLKAADLEPNDAAKKAVLRKALEANPSSVTLWKAAIDLEDADDARVLLSVAVEKIPHSVDMWLALARLETYEKAQKVLNRARKALPTERTIWLAAAKLEESQNHNQVVEKIVERAVKSLQKHDAVVTRAQWLHEAETAEAAGAPLTSAAIVKFTVGYGVEQEDRQRTWADDATGALARGSVATARAILTHSLAAFPTKRSLWMQAVDMERKHGTPETLDETLAAASKRLPRVEIFWLVRAKEQWLAGNVGKARDILTEAFAANPDSEAVWLAAAKLEWETGEIERARVLLQRARERAPTDRVYMKSALLEREQKNFKEALSLLEEGISNYKSFPKLYMMGGQICSEDLAKEKSNLDKARKFYQRGLQECPQNVILWALASRLEEKAHTFDATGTVKPGLGVTKARGLLEIARLKNNKNPLLWLESIRLERRANNDKLADSLTARALQECPNSGLLLAENIASAPRAAKKSKSADAIKRLPEDPLVIAAVATLFASDRKNEKARKWFDRAVILDPDIGDSWARFYAFELEVGTKEQQDKVKERCVKADPKHGELWTNLSKDMANRHKPMAELLELVARKLLSAKNGDA